MSASELAHGKMPGLIRRIPTGIPGGWEEAAYAAGDLVYTGFSNVCTEKLPEAYQ